MLFGELLKRTACKRSTLDRYVRLDLIPYAQNLENNYRKFPEEAINRVELIRLLTKRPFRLDLEEIRNIFQKVPIVELVAKKEVSIQHLLQFLNENNLL
jgi:DNA-binding transcriptional MerR regulator